MPLTSAKIRAAKPADKQYKMFDAKGLFLLVRPNGSMYWRLRYRFEGKEKLLALGVYPEITLTYAREKQTEARQLLAQGFDPSGQRQEIKKTKRAASNNTFNKVFFEWWENRQLKNLDSKSEARTKRLFDEDVLPIVGDIPIAEITSDKLLACLNRLKARGAIHSMGRLRQKISEVYRHSIATGRTQVNLADAIKDAIPQAKQKHHSALVEPKQVGQLMLAIESYPSTPIVKAALKLSALWFLRVGELRHSKWSEVNWEERRLEIPAERMKMKEPHIVPLSSQALAILRELEANHKNGEYILPSARSADRPLSENGVRVALRSMGYTNEQHTPHGFRATARTLLDEELGFRVEWIEQQLAHTVRDMHGRAYNRTKHLPQRTEMMQRWADYMDELKPVSRHLRFLQSVG